MAGEALHRQASELNRSFFFSSTNCHGAFGQIRLLLIKLTTHLCSYKSWDFLLWKQDYTHGSFCWMCLCSRLSLSSVLLWTSVVEAPTRCWSVKWLMMQNVTDCHSAAFQMVLIFVLPSYPWHCCLGKTEWTRKTFLVSIYNMRNFQLHVNILSFPVTIYSTLQKCYPFFST